MTLDDRGYSIKFDTKSKEVKFNSLLKLESTNLSEITFSKKGKPSYINDKSSAGTIIFSIGDKRYKITIQPVTGKVNFYDYKE